MMMIMCCCCCWIETKKKWWLLRCNWSCREEWTTAWCCGGGKGDTTPDSLFHRGVVGLHFIISIAVHHGED